MARSLPPALLLVIAAACSGEPVGGDDPLALPDRPTLTAASFPLSESCADCHPTHYTEWKTSQHAQAMTNLAYQVLVSAQRKDHPGDRFCFQCHSPIGTRSWEIGAGFTFDAAGPVARDGVNCATCHRVHKLVRTANAGIELDEQNVVYGPLADASRTSAHESRPSGLFQQSRFCGACHDLYSPGAGLWLEAPFQEWTQKGQAASGGKECQDCHMPATRGPVAMGGAERTRHSHRFAGADVQMVDGDPKDPQWVLAEEARQQLLRGAAAVTVAAEPLQVGEALTLNLSVESKVSGHRLPTGSGFSREIWLALRVTDAKGQVLYQTPQPEAGDGPLPEGLRPGEPVCDALPEGARSSGALASYRGLLFDAAGKPTPLPWKVAVFDNRAPLDPGEQRRYTVKVPLVAGDRLPLQVQAAVCFRPFSPAVLDALGIGHLRARMPTVAMDQAQIQVGG